MGGSSGECMACSIDHPTRLLVTLHPTRLMVTLHLKEGLAHHVGELGDVLVALLHLVDDGQRDVGLHAWRSHAVEGFEKTQDT